MWNDVLHLPNMRKTFPAGGVYFSWKPTYHVKTVLLYSRYREAASDFLALNPDSQVGSPGFHQVSRFLHSFLGNVCVPGTKHWGCIAPSGQTKGQPNLLLIHQDLRHGGIGQNLLVPEQELCGWPGVADSVELAASSTLSPLALQLQLPRASPRLSQGPKSQVGSLLPLWGWNPGASQALDTRFPPPFS